MAHDPDPLYFWVPATILLMVLVWTSIRYTDIAARIFVVLLAVQALWLADFALVFTTVRAEGFVPGDPFPSGLGLPRFAYLLVPAVFAVGVLLFAGFFPTRQSWMPVSYYPWLGGIVLVGLLLLLGHFQIGRLQYFRTVLQGMVAPAVAFFLFYRAVRGDGVPIRGLLLASLGFFALNVPERMLVAFDAYRSIQGSSGLLLQLQAGAIVVAGGSAVLALVATGWAFLRGATSSKTDLFVYALGLGVVLFVPVIVGTGQGEWARVELVLGVSGPVVFALCGVSGLEVAHRRRTDGLGAPRRNDDPPELSKQPPSEGLSGGSHHPSAAPDEDTAPRR